MVKTILFLILLWQFSFASSIEREVENIIGKGSFAAKKGLIAVLFKNRSDFLVGSKVDMLKVLTTLKTNNLLDLSLPGSQELELSFATTQNKPLFFIKTIKDTLNAMGYNHLLTSKAVRDESGFLWKVVINSAAVIDPLLLAHELQKRGASLTNIQRYSKENWRFNIDINRAHLDVQNITFNKSVILKKPLKPYWINVNGARAMTIDSLGGNNWHPYIVIYDSNLNILDNYTKEIKSYNVPLKIPGDAAYIQISDFYTLENIKRGLKVYISQKR